MLAIHSLVTQATMKNKIQLLPLMLISTAFADPTPSALQACVAEKDAAARLACFDRETTAPPATTQTNTETTTHQSTAESSVAPTNAKASIPVPTAASVAVPIAAFGAAEPSTPWHPRDEYTHNKLQPFTSSVTQVKRTGFGQLTLDLENGQRWQQTDGVVEIFVSVNDIVAIRPGHFGGYFLKTPDHRSFRFQRIH
jgi:hypothetical protein